MQFMLWMFMLWVTAPMWGSLWQETKQIAAPVIQEIRAAVQHAGHSEVETTGWTMNTPVAAAMVEMRFARPDGTFPTASTRVPLAEARAFDAAMAQLRAGLERRAADGFAALAESTESDTLRATAYFNIACAHAQRTPAEAGLAIEYLERALQAGFADQGWILDDPDLAPVDLARRKALLGRSD